MSLVIYLYKYITIRHKINYFTNIYKTSFQIENINLKMKNKNTSDSNGSVSCIKIIKKTKLKGMSKKYIFFILGCKYGALSALFTMLESRIFFLSLVFYREESDIFQPVVITANIHLITGFPQFFQTQNP